MTRPLSLALVAAVLLAAGSVGTAAAGDVQVNTYTTGEQRFPSVAVDAEGNAVVTWTSDGSSGTDHSGNSVQGQLNAADGSPVGGEFQVNTYTTDVQSGVSVAMTAKGDFIVVWNSSGSSGNDTSSFSIQGQRYAADGSHVGGEFQVNSYTTSSQFAPSVAMDGAGNFVVLWLSSGSGGTDTSGFSVQGQLFASSGLPAGAQFQVNTYTSDNQKPPSVAMADAGEFVVVWETRDFFDGEYKYYSVHAQRYASDGSPAGPGFGVNSYTTSNQFRPSVAMDGAGNFVVVWQNYYLYGQRFAADGSPVGSQFEVSEDGSFYRNDSMAMNADGDFMVVWHENDTSSSGLVARRYDSFGSPAGDPFQINAYTTNQQQYAAVALDDAGDYVVAWESGASGGTDTDGSSIQRTGCDLIFGDGFESGDTNAWD